MTMLVEPLSRSSTGTPVQRVLVIAGGGAKGAYSFGCLKALRERGFKFSAVSGTSVGALNAILWAADKLEEGEKLWRSISFSTVYPVAIMDPERNPKFFIKTVAMFYVAMRLIWSSFWGVPTPGRPLWIAFAALLPILPMLLYPARSLGGLGIIALVMFYVPTYFILLSRTGDRLYMTGFAVVSGWIFLVGLLPDSLGLSNSDSISIIWIAEAFVVGWLCSCGLRYVFRDNFSVLSQSALAHTIAKVVESGLNIPTIVTMARNAGIFDPDNPGWWREQSMSPLVMDGQVYWNISDSGNWQPGIKIAWVPVYLNVEKYASEVITKLCLASAALPFGIVPPIRIGKFSFSDGGVIDNCPVFPFLNLEANKEMFVLLLEPVKSESKVKRKIGIDPKKWAERDRDLRVAEAPIPPSVKVSRFRQEKVNKTPKEIPYRTLSYIPRTVMFYPKKSLGGFLSGTLRFEGDYAASLVDQGYKDALETIDKEFGPQYFASNPETEAGSAALP